MVNTDITSLFRMPRAPCFPHTRFCQINFDILRIIDSSLNFKCYTMWGRNSQSILQSRVSENKGIKPGRRSTLIWRKALSELHNLNDSDNRSNEGKSKKASNSVISEPHVSHRGGTVPETSSFPHPPLSSTTQSHYTKSKYALASTPTDTSWLKHSSSAKTVIQSVCIWTTPRNEHILVMSMSFYRNEICLPIYTYTLYSGS